MMLDFAFFAADRAVEEGENAAKLFEEEGAKVVKQTQDVEKVVKDNLDEQEKEEIKE